MKIEYRAGNLFLDPTLKHLVHCCNDRGQMGSGFAKELRKRYSGAYEDYYNRWKVNKGLSLGSVLPFVASDGVTIFNLIGQQGFGQNGARYVSYDAITNGIIWINEHIEDCSELLMPTMGAVLAGGKWPIIAAIVEEYSTRFKPVVYLFDGKLPA